MRNYLLIIPKTGLKLIAPLLIAITFSQQATAQGAAPSLFGVKEIVLQPAQFTPPRLAESCGIMRSDISDIILSMLKAADVPVIDVNEAPPSIAEIARIYLKPEIIFANNGQVLDCTSWVSLSAESKNNLVIPPVNIQKNVQIIYWHESAVVTSTQSAHAQAINDVIKKLTGNFAKQYTSSQPQKIK